MKLVFVSLAGNQAEFYGEIGKHLIGRGVNVAHICFHEPSIIFLKSLGQDVYNPYRLVKNVNSDFVFSEHGIDNPLFYLSHEMAAYQISDTKVLLRKFSSHLENVSKILEIITESSGQIAVVQEIGGFASVLAAYFSARSLEIDNHFIEASFFRGRIFITKNQLASPSIVLRNTTATNEVLSAIAEILDQQVISMPFKDRKHFRGIGKKLLDLHNVKRLVSKLFSKYFCGQKEEFDHIFGHLKRHFSMAMQHLLLHRHFTTVPDDPFIYFPLHVPSDVALTLRSPNYLNQYKLIEQICKNAPRGYKVAIKEHPAMVGSLIASRIKVLMEDCGNLVVIDPTINNHRVIAQAEVVITINSKAGAEAILHRKPLIVLGDAFYAKCPFVHTIKDINSLKSVIQDCTNGIDKYSQKEVEEYFQLIWEQSYGGELYNLDQNNCSSVASSLCEATGLRLGSSKPNG